MRRTAFVAVGLLLAAGTGVQAQQPDSSAVAPVPDYVFVSAPDFLNQDVADVRGHPCSLWEEGDPNSTADGYEEQLDVVLADIATHGATDLLVAGDLVEGRWGRDREETGNFGPVGTYDEQLAAYKRAACAYYPAWQERVDRHGFRSFPAVGDHEIGDGHWNIDEDGEYAVFKHRALPVFNRQWASYVSPVDGTAAFDQPDDGPSRRTAYATQLADEVLLVTVDVFRRTSRNVVIDVRGEQLRWLRGVLARAKRKGTDWVLVQGHVPVLRPVRSSRSSWPPLVWRERSDSPFWRALREFDVDAYLAGEVHATTALRQGRVTQISHGGLFYAGEFSYLVGEVHGRRLRIETRAFTARLGDGDRLWQTARRVGRAGIVYSPESHVTGTMVLDKNGTVVSRSGLLAPYSG